MGAHLFGCFRLELQMRRARTTRSVERELPPANEAGFRSVKSGEGFGDVIVPGEAFLIQQRPQQAEAAGAIAEARAHEAQPARNTVRRVAVEVDERQTESAHAGSPAAGAHPYESIEYADQYGGGAHDQDLGLAIGERAAQQIENCEKESA